jgi:hypothetical protein
MPVPVLGLSSLLFEMRKLPGSLRVVPPFTVDANWEYIMASFASFISLLGMPWLPYVLVLCAGGAFVPLFAFIVFAPGAGCMTTVPFVLRLQRARATAVRRPSPPRRRRYRPFPPSARAKIACEREGVVLTARLPCHEY